MYGIELDTFSPNASNGTIQEISYFTSQKNRAYFAEEDDLLTEDEKINDKIQRLTQYPAVGDKIKLVDGKEGTVKLIEHFSISLSVFFQYFLHRFVGQILSANGLMIGIELSKWCVNGNNGSVNGRAYFSCKLGHGYFVALNQLVQILEATGWVCSVCTYTNKITKQKCDMCGLSKDASNKASEPIDTTPSSNADQYKLFGVNTTFKPIISQSRTQQDRIFTSFDVNQMNASGITTQFNSNNTWKCPICTYNNSSDALRCIACNTQKPDDNRQYQQHQQPQQPSFGIPSMGMGVGAMNFDMTDATRSGSNEMKYNRNKPATIQEFQNSASDIACYNDNPSQVFATLRSVAKKLLKDDLRYRTLDTTNPRVMERLIGFEGVLDFLMLLGFESDAMGMKLVCEQKPSQQLVRNAIEVLNTYESRMNIARNNNGNNDDNHNDNNGDQQDDTLTLEQILLWSTQENMRDLDMMETLVLTHKLFTNSVTLLKQLRRRFDVPIPNDLRDDELKIKDFRSNVQKRIQLKVIKASRDWMKNYWHEDFAQNPQLQEELKAWLSDLEQLKATLATECPWIAPLSAALSKEYQRLKSSNNKLSNDNKLDPKTGVPKYLEYVSIKKGYGLSNSTAQELAEQITLMDHHIFSNISPRECIGQKWKKRKEEAPNVLAMINQFNNLTVFIQLSILSEKSVRDRAKCIKRIIQMGQRFKELKNFNSLCAVIGALNSSPIHRLKVAWQKVSQKQLNLFESFKKIFVNTRNFHDYRTMFRGLSPPAIPYFGLFLQDLVFIDDGNDQFRHIANFKQHGYGVNFNKCVRMADRIKNMTLYQASSYRNLIKSQDFLQKILYQEFHKMKDFTENGIWDLSTKVRKSDQAKR